MEETPQTTEANKSTTIAMVAYLTIIGLIAAIVLNKDTKDPFTSFHIRQSLGLIVTGFAVGIIGIIPFLGWLISIVGTICVIILWLMGFINAINGNEKPVPILGEKYAEWFKNV